VILVGIKTPDNATEPRLRMRSDIDEILRLLLREPSEHAPHSHEGKDLSFAFRDAGRSGRDGALRRRCYESINQDRYNQHRRDRVRDW
jgi:hypothetical protein